MFYIVVALSAVALDQLTKLLAASMLRPIGSVTVIPWLLSFTYVENTGAAFGMLEGMRWMFVAVAAVAAVVIAVLILRRVWTSPLMLWGLALIAGGALGNMVDRAAQGFVVDFIELGFMRFGVFNIADLTLTVGVALVVLYYIFLEVRLARERKAAKAALADGGAATLENAPEDGENCEQSETNKDKCEENGDKRQE